MKAVVRNLFLLALIFSLSTYRLFAQNYKWVKGGGSVDDLTMSSLDWEQTLFMCTDVNKNLYAIQIVGGDTIRADTFFVATAPNTTVKHFMLSSYTCNGTMRWAKLFSAYWDAVSRGLVYDGGASIYCAGNLANYNKHIGYDTVITSANLTTFVARFDTSGKLKWVHFIGQDIPSNIVATYGYPAGSDYGNELAIDKNGYIHYYHYIRNGVQITPTILSTSGTYDIKYDSTGNLLNATKMSADTNFIILKALFNKSSNSLYTIAGNSVTGGLVAFNETDSQLWYDSCFSGNLNDIAYDGTGKYIYGVSWGTPLIFQRDTLSKINTSSFLRVDTNGHPDKAFGFTKGNSALAQVAILPNGNIAGSFEIIGEIKYGLDSISTPGGEHSGIMIIDTTGKLVFLDQFTSNGAYDWPWSMTSDKDGSIYVGGDVENQISAGSVPAYTSNGGNTDFYIVKYGYNCNCTVSAEPTPKFSYVGSGLVNFTYTGSVTPDSVRWNFGDGTISKTLNPTHNFHDTGEHHVCLTVFACDSGTFCNYIQTTTGVPSISGLQNVNVYPNPVREQLFIEGAEKGTRFMIVDLLGQQVFNGVINENKQILSLNSLQPGMYFLNLLNSESQKASVKIIKQ